MTIYISTFANCYYLQHAMVLLTSLNRVVNKNNTYHVYFFHTCKNKSIISKVTRTVLSLKRNIVVELYFIDFKLNLRLQSKKENYSREIYYKIFIFQYLPSTVKKTLFLDADIVLNSDPSYLFKLNLEGRILGAVKDIFLKFPVQARDAINLKSSDDYFNSGVMIIDLIKWREMEISKKAYNFALEKGQYTKLHDQDGFNFAVRGRWLRISKRWNPRPYNEIKDKNGREVTLLKNELYRKGLAYLVHFSGSDKPWFYTSNHPLKKLYWKYLMQTEFKDYQYPDKNWKNRIIKLKNYLKWEFIYAKREIERRFKGIRI